MIFDFVPPNILLARLQEIRDKIDNAGIRSDIQSLNAKLPSATSLSDSLSNPSTTIIGSALLGYDDANTVWRRLKVTADGKLQLYLG